MMDGINSVLQWLLDALLYVPKSIFEWLLDILATIIENIPVPDFFTNASSALSHIPASVMYWIEPFNLGAGLGIIISAYTLRFIIRRIPIIG